MTPFHKTYYELLDAFAHGRISRLLVSVPPQHGKSLGSSRLLPSYMLGLNPDLRISVGSYSFGLARKFGQGVRQVLESAPYRDVFPATYLKGFNGTSRNGAAMLTSDEFDCVGRSGGMRVVGRECALTGTRVDVMILDDIYKDAMEANSPVIRENTWDWYTSVVRTRMHNDSREIIVFTRWHEDDLIGRLSRTEQVVDIRSLAELDLVPARAWVRVNFEALKNTPATKLDPRKLGEALWPGRHSAELLSEKRALDASVFEALYQGNPSSKEGFLYSTFATYNTLPEQITHRANYTDTADTGDDYLCSISYAVSRDGMIYLTEVVYSKSPMEVTERLVVAMLCSESVHVAQIESNNGGRGFARSVDRQIRAAGGRTQIRTFHQSASKEARILSNATEVMRRVVMPADWQSRWSEFAQDLTDFRRSFRANAHDDAADALTGVVENETSQKKQIHKLLFLSH